MIAVMLAARPVAVTGMPTMALATEGAKTTVEPKGAVAEAIVGAVEVMLAMVAPVPRPVPVTGMPTTAAARLVVKTLAAPLTPLAAVKVGAAETRLLTVVPAAMPVPPTYWPTEKLVARPGKKRLPAAGAAVAVRPVLAARASVPVPALVRLKAPETTPPRDNGAEPATLRVRAAVRATAPVPRFRACVPPKVVAPLIVIVGLDVNVKPVSEVLSKTVNGARTKLDAPLIAPALFRYIEPSCNVTAPVKVLAFQSARVPVALTLVRVEPESLAVTTLLAIAPFW